MRLLKSLFILVVISGAANAQAETFEWSGYKWNVRNSNGQIGGPGKNIFSDSKEHVFVDDEGNLHLKILKNDKEQWEASEVSLSKSLGYGTYEWEMSSRYDTLPPNVVVGLFTYISPKSVAEQTDKKVGDGTPDTPHEIDIEMTGSWGDANLFFTTHDPDIQSPSKNFYQKLNGDYTTHRFTWKPDEIFWSSFNGHVAGEKNPTNYIVEEREGDKKGERAEVSYKGPVVPKALDEVPIINFWLFGKSVVENGPTDGKSQELIIKRFIFTPLEK